MKATNPFFLSASFFTNEFYKSTTLFNKLCEASQNYVTGLSQYTSDFFMPYLTSTHYFGGVESEKAFKTSPQETLRSYLGLLDFNMDLCTRAFCSGFKTL